MSGWLSGVVLSVLGGHAALWFGWACRRRPWNRQQVARGILGLGAAAVVVTRRKSSVGRACFSAA